MMQSIYSCLVNEHDLRLVVLAGIICAVSSFTAFNLLHHVARTRGAMRRTWLCVAAVASGFGIWATHFIAMLAYSKGIQSGYDFPLTLLSLVAAVFLTGIGFASALSSEVPAAKYLGGATVGFGIGVMHYTGMAAFRVPGIIEWDTTLVVASLLVGAVLGALAMRIGMRGRSLKSMSIGGVILTAAICGLHFTGMGAATIIPDPRIDVPDSSISTSLLVLLVSLGAVTIFLLALAGRILDHRERRQAEREAVHMRELANAAFEGLIVTSGGLIATVNASLADLAGVVAESLTGRALEELLPVAVARRQLEETPNVAFETVLMQSGAMIPVEVISRSIVFANRPHQAIAVRDLRDRKKAENDIYFLAHHDTLTGLPNRATFNEKLDGLIEAHSPGGVRSGSYLAVLCLDLDRFKEVNDLFGHAAGDNLLKMVGQCARKVLSKGQMIARLGGDEFAVVAPGLDDPTQAGRIAESLLAALMTSNEEAASSEALVSTSIGIAIFPRDADDRTTLLSHADTALYRAKAEGRGTYRFFESAMGEQVRDRRRIEHDLRFAITRNELALVYQPQARTRDREVTGFEALLRWTSAERGAIPPSVFIPIAEESGLILKIGEWVLIEACREAVSWSRPLAIAVNVSTAQLHSPNFAQLVQDVLTQTGLSADRLELEITETALIRDLNRALTTLGQLKALGVRIAMDDFGTGYSSLSNLRAFPFDKIKIDRSFITNVDENSQAATIVRAVLGLGRGLELPVVAEGVETEEELEFLNAESCEEAQGYFLGRPQPIEAFRDLLDGTGSADGLIGRRSAAA